MSPGAPARVFLCLWEPPHPGPALRLPVFVVEPELPCPSPEALPWAQGGLEGPTLRSPTTHLGLSTADTGADKSAEEPWEGLSPAGLRAESWGMPRATPAQLGVTTVSLDMARVSGGNRPTDRDLGTILGETVPRVQSDSTFSVLLTAPWGRSGGAHAAGGGGHPSVQ